MHLIWSLFVVLLKSDLCVSTKSTDALVNWQIDTIDTTIDTISAALTTYLFDKLIGSVVKTAKKNVGIIIS
jgi:hypothetical protein